MGGSQNEKSAGPDPAYGQAHKQAHKQAMAHAEDVRKGGSPDALLRAMMSMLVNRGGVLLPAEEDQFVPLIRDVAARAQEIVRQNLAHLVAGMAHAPRGLYEFLAHDTIDVARPLLVECAALDDDFLIEIVEEESSEHAKVIATRAKVSALVSAAIVSTGAEDAILILLNNPGSSIAPPSFAELTRQSEARPGMQRAIIKRKDLPVVLAQQIFWMVGTGLRQEIMERFPIYPEELDGLLADAVAQGLADPVALEIREGLHHLTEMGKFGVRLSVPAIIGHMKAGRVEEFADGASTYLGIRHRCVKRILNDQGGEALAILCRALDADRAQFTSVLLKNDYRRFGTPRPPGQIEKISQIYDRVGPEHALAAVQMWDALDSQIAA